MLLQGRPLQSSWLVRRRGDRAQADGLAVPLAVDDAVLQMALNYFVSDRHNCYILEVRLVSVMV